MKKNHSDIRMMPKKCIIQRCCYCFFALFLWIGTAYAQSGNQIDTKTVALGFAQEKLSNALLALEKASGFRLVFPSEPVNAAPLVNLTKEERTIAATLQLILKETPLNFTQNGNTIVLFLRNEKPTNGRSDELPPRTVHGTVVDEDGLPMPGTMITVKNNPKKYTTADIDGKFQLTDVKENAVLVFSHLGCATIEEPIGNRNTIAVTMKEEINTLDDVVVTGYQTISRERAAGAFDMVKSSTIEKSLSSDLSTALLGTTAGMQGKENADGSIDFTIRGVGTLYADQTPLIVVDGFPAANGFKDINPNDVENVTVLKDAAAASIWGARSGNGVIVITTKKPSIMGRLTIEANASVRIGQKTDLSTALTTASSKDQVAYEKYYFENNWADAYFDAFMFLMMSQSLASEYLTNYRNGKISEAEMNAGLDQLSRTNNRGQIKKHLLQNPILQQYNISVSQATQRSKNYLSALYETQVANMIKNGTDRWKLNFSNQTSVFKWLDFNISANLHYAKQNTSGPTLSEMGALSPYEMILNEDGTYATQVTRVRDQLAKIPAGAFPYDDWTYNLLREVRGRDLTSTSFNTRLVGGLTFKLLPDLTYASNFMYEYNNGETDNYYSEDTYFVRDMVNQWVAYREGDAQVSTQYLPKGGILKQPFQTNSQNYSWRNQINFNRTFNDKHSVTALAGMEITENEMTARTYPWVFGYDPDKNTSAYLPYGDTDIRSFLSSGPGASRLPRVTNTTFGYRNDRYVSVYGNVAYSFDNKYNLTASIRSDASNMIADDASYRWTPLWSIGAMWHAHQEKFMSNVSWLDRLTARLTFGYNGNVDKGTSPYTLLSVSSTPSISTGTFINSIAAMGNPTLRWEKTHTLNFGIDFSAFNNVLFGSIDLYNKEGKDIIGSISLPSVTGSASKKLNVAGVYNRGVEVTLGANARVTDNIGISTKVTYAYNKNKITQLFRTNVVSRDLLYGGSGSYAEGYPVNAVWAYNYLGMDEGLPYVEGMEGEPFAITNMELHTTGKGLECLQYMGPTTDPHTLGWTGGIAGYGLNLSFTITGKFGGHFRTPAFVNYAPMGRGKNIVPLFISEVLNGSDKQPSLPATGSIPPNFAYWQNYVPYLNTMVESSSFIKWKEITLEYSLPKRWMNAIGVKRVKVYGQVRDLGCLYTANSRHYDPEWLPGTMKPSTSYALGININF